jgi:hypothetical protein
MAGWRRRKPRVPLVHRPWPQHEQPLSTQVIQDLYGQGFSGTLYDPQAEEQLFSSQQWPDGEQAAYEFGLVGSGAGKLSLPFLYAWAQWPKMWPSPGQTTGSCVSKAGKNVAAFLIGIECGLGLPDAATGLVEGFPELTDLGIAQGVVASEPIYGYRGHSGQGASCSRLIQYVMTAGGILLRKDYPELGVSFEKADDSVGARWGGRGTPANVNAEGKKHQIRAAADCPNHEVCRDMVANGKPIWVCSSLGWSSQRDENGYSRQQGSWSHSWDIIGYDDRPATVQKYGFALALYIHDWWKWNSGPRDIRDSADQVPAHLKQDWIAKGLVNPATGNILIPEGCMWIKAPLLDRCDCTALSETNGWPARVIDHMLI